MWINLKSVYSKEDWESLNSLSFSTKWGQYVVEKSQTGIFYNELERDIIDKANLLTLSTTMNGKLDSEAIYKARNSLMEIALVLFNDRLENIPLRLQSKDADVRKVAKWRLSRGV